MKAYNVNIIETLTRSISVEANNESEAIQKIKELYEKGSVVLYPEECDIEVQYEVTEKDISDC